MHTREMCSLRKAGRTITSQNIFEVHIVHTKSRLFNRNGFVSFMHFMLKIKLNKGYINLFRKEHEKTILLHTVVYCYMYFVAAYMYLWWLPLISSSSYMLISFYLIFLTFGKSQSPSIQQNTSYPAHLTLPRSSMANLRNTTGEHACASFALVRWSKACICLFYSAQLAQFITIHKINNSMPNDHCRDGWTVMHRVIPQTTSPDHGYWNGDIHNKKHICRRSLAMISMCSSKQCETPTLTTPHSNSTLAHVS